MKKENKWLIWFLMLIAFLLAFGGVSQTFAAYPESDARTHYMKHGDRIGYFDDGYLYWADRIVPSSAGTRWHVMGYRAKVTANGRTAYADYSIGGGMVNPFKTKSAEIKAEAVNRDGYRYTRDGLNYNELIEDITAKNKTLGRDMSSGSHDVKIVFDSITEIYNASTKKQISGNHTSASSLKTALKKYGMSTGAVDNYYGMTTTIQSYNLPIVKYVTKGISFPSGGSFHNGGTTYYVKPGKLVYVDTTFKSQKVNMTNQYFSLGDKKSGTAELLNDYVGRYDYSSRKFVESNGSGSVNWSSNSSGPSASNANSNVKVRNAFSFNGTGDTWWTYAESKNANGIYYGGSSADYVFMYAFITDGAVPTFGGIPSSAWRNTDYTFTPTVADSGSGIKVARLKQNGTTVQTISKTARDTSESYTARKATAVTTYVLEAEDNVGNTSSKTFKVNIDKGAPSLSVAKSPTSWTNGSVTLTASASDSLSGIKSIKLPNGKTVTGSSASQVVTANGTYTFIATDVAGNTKKLDVSVTNIDKTAPTGSLSQTPTAWTNGNVTLNLTSIADSGGSGVKNIKLPNGTYTTGTSASYTVSSNNTYSFVIYDNAGNATTKTITVSNIDKVVPTGNVSQTPTAWTNGNVTLNLTSIADSGGSGVKNIKLPNGSFVTGASASQSVSSNGTYSFVIYDNAGNATTKSITVSNIEKIAPTANLSQTPTGWTKGSVTLNLTSIADSGGSGLKNTKLPNGNFVTGTSASQVVTANGTYTFTVYDNAGNATNKSITVSNIDQTAPTGLLTRNPTAWTDGNVTLTLSGVSDGSGSGLKHIIRPDGSLVTGSSSATFSATANGSYTFKMVDNVGNESSRSISVTNIDKVTPSATLNPNSISWTNDNQSISVALTDTGGSNLKNWRSRISTDNGSRYASWSGYSTGSTGTVALSSHGLNRIQIEVNDNAGNQRIVTSGIYYLDKVLPNGSVTPNTTAWTSGTVTLTASGTDADSGVSTIKKPDGSLVTASSTTYVVSANGTYSFVVTDKAENTRTVSYTVSNIDKLAPNGTLTQTPTDWTSGNVTLNLTNVSDTGGSNVKNIKLPNGALVTGTSASQVVSSNGTYSFVITDNAGNTKTLSITVSNIDKTAPTGTLTQTPTAWTKGNVTLNLTGVADGQSDIQHIKLPNGNLTTNTTVAYTVTANGTYTMEIEDNVGNKTTRSIKVTNIDKVLPTLSLVYDYKTNVIRATASDAQSGIQSITLPTGAIVNGTSASFTPPTQGKYTFKATDKAGNVTTKAMSLQSPGIEVGADTEDWTNQNVILTAEAFSTISKIDYIILPNGVKVYAEEATYSASANGTYSFTAFDKSGFSSSESITVSNIDKVKPAGTVKMIPGTTALTLQINGTDSLSGVNEIVLPNGNSVSGASASQTVTKAGSYTAVVVDNAGNRTNVVATVQAPTITISKEVSEWTNRDSYGLTALTTPRYVGTAKMQAPFASTSWITANQITAQISQNGTYQFNVNDGGITSTISVTVTNFDRQEPVITITEKAKSTTQGTYNIRITEFGDVKP